MDQLKVFLRQCGKHRFWIAVGISLLLPMIGYFVGSGTIVEATTKREAEIKGAKTDISKYTSPGIVNGQYQPIAATKKDALVKDVDATWRKLFALQEPLLKWPEVVEEKFRKWGRKYPSEVDRNTVTATIVDYTIAYPSFVSRVYKTFKPFNFEDGTGIVVAPDEAALIKPAPFSPDNPPDFGRVRAEQERLWVVTALLDAIAKVNDSVGAKDWDGAIVKQINAIEVGVPAAQDQKSVAKGETLAPADPLLPEGAAAAPPPAAPAPGAPEAMGGPAGTKSEGVYYLKTEGQVQYKVLPIMMKVLVEQSRLPEFLVGLENSPMSILVMEPEISKPLVPVVKPVLYADKNAFNMGGSGDGMAMMNPYMGNKLMGRGNNNNMPAPYSMGGQDSMRAMANGGKGMGGAPPAVKKGTDIRDTNKAEERKKALAKEAASAKGKAESKAKVDQYYNIIEVTVYGQARFYLAPPPPPEAVPSTASTTPAPAGPEAAKDAEPKAAEAPKKEDAPKDEAPKDEAVAPKVGEDKAGSSAPKVGEDKAGSSAPKAEAPKDEAPKAEPPKAEPPKAEAPKAEPPKAEPPKAETPMPKS